jgi:hypothetical protein
MQIPPLVNGKPRPEPPLNPVQRGPEGYTWDPSYPGTMHPGIAQDDCFPLASVLESGVYERMEYQELDMYERSPEIFTVDDDLLDWLAREGRFLERGAEDGDLDADSDKMVAGVTEEDLDFADDDDKMLAYYSKQGEGSAVGAGSDFGGVADSGGFDASNFE